MNFAILISREMYANSHLDDGVTLLELIESPLHLAGEGRNLCITIAKYLDRRQLT